MSDPGEQAQVATPARANPSRLKLKARRRVDKAYTLLANQPPSLACLSRDARAQVVISAVFDDAGKTIVISRVGDLKWHLWPFVKTPSNSKSEKTIDWSRIPEAYREAVQNVLYAYWKQGRPGLMLPEASSLIKAVGILSVFCRYARTLNRASLADLRPIHIANFVHNQKAAGKTPSTLSKIFFTVELLHLFRAEHEGALPFHPWPDSSALDMAGSTGRHREHARKAGLTPLIPMDVASALFVHAEGILDTAERRLDERDRGERSPFHDPEVSAIRDACFYLIGVLTGMRSSELASIEVGAGRTEEKNGFTFHWLSSTEYKTKKGLVEYLMPSMGHRILHILDRWSSPYRQLLAAQIAEMEQMPGRRTATELQTLSTARDNCNRIFLTKGWGGIVAVPAASWRRNLKNFARAAGTTWHLAPHQMRRLYAHTFVRHKLGDLLFLKEQFKHSSIDMSQLYAASPLQDVAIYDDILSELLRQKGEVIATWLEKDEPLTGGAGRKLMAMRAHEFPNRKALVMETSRRILMRSTGHSWCLAQDEGCGGSGIYQKGRCGSCRDGLIDRRFIPIWEEAYRHHKELLSDALMWGAGAAKRVNADLDQAGRILRDLGIDPEA